MLPASPPAGRVASTGGGVTPSPVWAAWHRVAVCLYRAWVHLMAVIESGIFASACATTRQLHPPRSVRAAYEQIVHDILDTHRDGILAGQLKQIADLPARCSGFRFAQGRCVERDADGLDRRIGQARGDEVGFEAEFQLGQRAIRQ